MTSARLLLAAGDLDGASNRAYFAMFAAAKAALTWSGAAVKLSRTRTHSGLIAAFSLHLVKTGQLPVELGKALNQAAELRLVADYTGKELTAVKVSQVVEQAESFVKAVREKFEPGGVPG